MTRIYPDYVYGNGPREDCWWDETCELPATETLAGDLVCDVAIVGAGFTGLSAALALAQSGRQVAVFDSHGPGWGASGRNGGFCCLGGTKLSDAQLDTGFGEEARVEWRHAERKAVDHVSGFLARYNIDADVHSQGETWLAHKPSLMDTATEDSRAFQDTFDTQLDVHSASDLAANGMSAGFHGGITVPFGFALNPRKYVASLSRACVTAGVSVYSNAHVGRISRSGDGWDLDVADHQVRTSKVLIASNGYSSDALPDWLSARYMPTQSSVIVTRPISDAERAAQGWTSYQMCYDSRNLLHYFRLMPNNRMLFGMRGGLGGSPASEQRARRRVRRDFDKMFPAWRGVETTNYWSGMVCISRRLSPFVGEVPDAPGLFAAMCFHGNGVAMGSYSGHLIGQLMAGGGDARPEVVKQPLAKFPLGAARRALLVPAYASYMLGDR
jgi:glycine/D-amino acid oxidase-like deaminating enzyme